MINVSRILGLLKGLKPFLPPALYGLAARLSPRVSWSGNYATWAAAEANSSNYADAAIFEKVENSVRTVLQGEAAFERDGALFFDSAPNFPLLAALAIAAQTAREARVTVVDFGGSLGSTYLQNKPWLEGLGVTWWIVEQPRFAAIGSRLFVNQPRFFASLTELAQSVPPGPVFLHFSASLQYLPEPADILAELRILLRPEWIYFDRVSFAENGPSRLTVQRIPGFPYIASYPCWFFARSFLAEAVGAGYEKVFTVPAADVCSDFPAQFSGSFWRRTKLELGGKVK